MKLRDWNLNNWCFLACGVFWIMQGSVNSLSKLDAFSDYPLVPLGWPERSPPQKTSIHLPLLPLTGLKTTTKVFAVLRIELAYFGLWFYLLCSLQLCLLCACFSLSASSESSVDITRCEAWGSKRLGRRVQVYRDFCLIMPQTHRL